MIGYPMRPTTGGPLSEDSLKSLPGRWAFQPKVNGWRGVIHVPTLTVFNRHGELLSITEEFSESLDSLWETAAPDMEWLDCEMLSRRHAVDRGKIIVLDWIVDRLPYWQRHDVLENTFAQEGLETISHTESAMGLWRALQQTNVRLGCDYYEGIVGKQWDSPYVLQYSATKTTPLWVKWRFDQYKQLEV